MMKKYYDKINELKELKNITIKNNQINSYNKEISLLKEKQKYLYDDFINNYNNKKDELDFKYKNKIAQAKDKNKIEIQNLNRNNNNTINNKHSKNSKILNLEKNISLSKKLKLYEKEKECLEEIKKEKNKLTNNLIEEKKNTEKLKLNNLNKKQNKKIDIIMMNYIKDKNELEIKFQKDKNELLNKFKNQLEQFKTFKNKNEKYEKIKYLYNNDYTNKLNKSFDAKILDKKLEEDENDISFDI